MTNVRDLARRLGLEVNRAGYMRCLWHPDGGRPNAKVYDDGVYCFRCGHQADAYDLVMTVKGVGFMDAKAELGEGYGYNTAHEPPDPLRDAPVLYERFCDLAHERALRPQRWFAERGISRDSVARFRLGRVDDGNYQFIESVLHGYAAADLLERSGMVNKDGRLRFYNRAVFPFHRLGNVVGFQARSLYGGAGPKWMGPTGCRLPLYNIDALEDIDLEADTLVWVCEGPKDTIIVSQTGRLAVGVPGATAWQPEQLAGLSGLSVVVAFDADDAGRRAMQQMCSSLYDESITDEIYVARWPDGTDAAEWDWGHEPPIERWEAE